MRSFHSQMPGAARGVPVPPSPDALTQLREGIAGSMFAAVLTQQIGDRDWSWFMYQPTAWNTLGASATASNPMQIEADSDFLALAAVAMVRTAAGAVVTDRSILVQAKNTGNGAYLWGEPTDFDMVFGTAQNPAYWGLPMLMARSSTFLFTLQNNIATAYVVRIGFWGIKVYGDSVK